MPMRMSCGAVIYDVDGTTSNIDFVGNENTFVLDASSEFDFFGYGCEFPIPMIQVVVLGSVGGGIRTLSLVRQLLA